MKYAIDKKEQYTLITLQEEKVDSVMAPELKTELVNLNAEGTKNIILDLSNIKYIDSSGLSSLLVGNRICGERNGVMVLCCINDHVMKLLKISQLDKVMNLVPTLQESIDSIFMFELEGEMNDEEEGKIEE